MGVGKVALELLDMLKTR